MDQLIASVLVLNRNYIPIDTTSARDAITLLYKGVAKSVSDDFQAFNFEEWIEYSKTQDKPKVSSAKLTIVIPDTILITNYADYPHRKIVLKYSRRNVFLRDSLRCQYCGHKFSIDELTIDHVIPKSKGGKNTYENVVSSCRVCNNKKKDKYLEESNMKLLSIPSAPNWYHKLKNHANWAKFFKEHNG
jgi:5-methylcytosine-specific restriction endonuclease McrA